MEITPTPSPTSTPTPAPEEGPVIYEPKSGPGQVLTLLAPGEGEKELAQTLADTKITEYAKLFEKLQKILKPVGIEPEPGTFRIDIKTAYALEGAQNLLEVRIQVPQKEEPPETGENFLFFAMVRTYNTRSNPRIFLGYQPVLLKKIETASGEVTITEKTGLYGYTVKNGCSMDELPQGGRIQTAYLQTWARESSKPTPPPFGGSGGCSLGLISLGELLVLLIPLGLFRGKR